MLFTIITSHLHILFSFFGSFLKKSSNTVSSLLHLQLIFKSSFPLELRLLRFSAAFFFFFEKYINTVSFHLHLKLTLKSCFPLKLFPLKFSAAFRNSRPEVFCKKGVFRNFAKFTGNHLCQSLFFNKVILLKRDPSTGVFL